MSEKKIEWLGSSYRDVYGFPVEAKREAGYQLGFIQQGLKPIDWKPLASIGKGVEEIRIHSGGEYRVIYVARFEEAVYVLHAFHKKTQKIPRKDIDLIKKRLSEVRSN